MAQLERVTGMFVSDDSMVRATVMFKPLIELGPDSRAAVEQLLASSALLAGDYTSASIKCACTKPALIAQISIARKAFTAELQAIVNEANR